MNIKHLRTLFSLVLLTLLSAYGSFAQAQKKTIDRPLTPDQLMNLDHNAKVKVPTGPNFEVMNANGAKTLYSVMLHSEDRSFVQTLLTVGQLEIMEAIVTEAKKFGMTEEAVGGAKPITTRFSDKQVADFFVDVSKVNRLTRFYVSLRGNGSVLTVDAGGIKRNPQKKDEPTEPILFDTVIERIHTAKQSIQ